MISRKLLLGLLSAVCGLWSAIAPAQAPSGAVYRAVMVTTNGVLVGPSTNLPAANGIATTCGREAITNYSVVAGGGIWDGAVLTYTSTGTSLFLAPDQRFLSGISYSHNADTEYSPTLEYLSATGWVTSAAGDFYEPGIVTGRIVVAAAAPPPPDGTNALVMSNFVITCWARSETAGLTNDLRGTIVRVDRAVAESDAVPYSQMTADIAAAAGAVTPAQWASYPALAAVNLNGNDLDLDASYTWGVSNGTALLTYQGAPIITVAGGGLTLSQIQSFSVAAGTGTVTVSGAPGWRPYPEWSPDLVTPSWTAYATNEYASTYPTLAAGLYTLTFALVTNTPAYYRISATNESGSAALVTISAPVTATSFTGAGSGLTGITAAQVGAVATGTLGTAAYSNFDAFATAAQGALADTALQQAGGTITGSLTVSNLTLSAVTWIDLIAPGMSLAGASQAPALADTGVGAGIKGMGYDLNDAAYGVLQMPHSLALTNATRTVLYVVPHVHWSFAAAPTPPATNVTWELIYEWANIGGGFATVGTNIVTVGAESATTSYLTSFGNVTNNGAGISSIFRFRLGRATSATNDYGATRILLDQFDLHVPVDRIGSSQETSQ